MKKLFTLLLLLPFIFSCGSDDNAPIINTPTPEPETQVEPEIEPEPEVEETSENLLLQLNGTQLVDADQNPVYLQGVAFTNFIWEDSPVPNAIHHNETDYERVSAMGMNTIRFYMNYTVFEDDSNPYVYKQTAWDWLDQNIAWAKKHNIYLVLNMHAPQGGYQSQGDGDALWDVLENQNRLAALWKAIAEKYKDEVQIAGFGPVNEPVPSQSMTQWNALAQRLINDIRDVNKNHLLFIEQAIYVQGSFTKDENFNFPDVTGENLVFEFHGYEPFFYSHQLLDFSELGDGGKYPDEEIVEIGNSTWHTANFDNPRLPEGNTDWTFFEGAVYTVNDADIALGLPALIAAEIGGKIYYDDIIVKEFDEEGIFIRNIYDSNLNNLSGWSFWSENDSGAYGLSNTEGHNDTSSFFVENTTADSNMSFSNGRFEITQGYSYQISGWMKGEDITNDFGGQIRLDFYKVEGDVLKRNKTYLNNFITSVTAWAKTKNAALYMGEFGAGTPCFQDEKGGLIWVADMVDILKTNNIHFTYHAYHEDAFGLYLGSGLPDPNNVNQPLIDWFTENLN